LLRQRIGRGGMGHVYEAEHRLLKRVVALKLVGRKRRGNRHAALRRRFRREVEAAGRLRHPGFVNTLDAGEADGRFYLAMELIEGIDLERLVRDSGPLSVPLACEIVRQAARALQHAHECGLLHRDIKPSNLMLAPPGIRVKLLDLGLACRSDRSRSTPSKLASDAELGGTPDYMAPEWWHDRRQVDSRADLYSLGCTFYFLLTGRVPFPGESWAEKVLRHNLDAPLPVGYLRPDVPAEVGRIVERMMARERDDRYPSAAAVAADLAASCDPPAQPGPTEIPPPVETRKPRPRILRFSLAATIAVLLGVLAAGGARWMVNPAPEAPVRADEPTAIVRPAPTAPFGIEGRAERYASLEKALAAAGDGDILTIRGPGPFALSALHWQAKALTLRAEKSTRPRLVMRAADDPWQALFHTDRTLTLEGLEIASPTPASLVRCEGASLYLRDCRLTGPADGAAIIARNPAEAHLERCRIDAGLMAVSLEVGRDPSCRLRLIECQISTRHPSGTALSLWAPEIRQPTTIEMKLIGNTIQASQAIALRSLPARSSITARRNRFTYRSALLSYTGDADTDAWRRNTVWQGGENTYDGPAAWLTVEGCPVPLDEKRSSP
jgi:tRNA A-37 threonylcarbamoyl transferase component Bud32